MAPIEILLETLKHGGKQSHLNLTLIPLLEPVAGEVDLPFSEVCLREKGNPNGLTVAEIAQREETAIRTIYRDPDSIQEAGFLFWMGI